MAEEIDPWAEFRPKTPVVAEPSVAPAEDDPWAKFRVPDPASPVEDLRGDQNYPRDLDTLTKEVATDAEIIDAAEVIQPDSVVGPELWDAVNNDPEYKDITNFEKTWGRVYSMEDLDKIPEPGTLPPEVQKQLTVDKKVLQAQFKARELKKKELFEKIGREVKDPSVIDKLYTGWDYKPRKQYKMEPNIDFDPTQDETDVNPRHKMSEFYVPPPDQLWIVSMGYQVARNLAGLGDMAYDAVVNQELNLSEEGVLRSQMPQNPMRSTDRFMADLTSFAIGPELAVGSLSKAGKLAVKGVDMAADALKYISPSTLDKAKSLYKSTLAKGGSHHEAFRSAQDFMSKVFVGTAIGLSEGSIADDDSQGIISPEFIQERTGMDARDAHDLSLFLDSPVISGTINTLGFLYRGGANLTEKSVGGLKATKPGKRLEMSQREAGFRMLQEIDPQLFSEGPELAVYRVKVLNDLLMQQGEEILTAGKATAAVTNDTTTATIRSAQKYFRLAYAHKAEEMGTKEFNEWVANSASDASNRLLSLKTALQNEAPIEKVIGDAQGTVQDLYSRAADLETTTGNVTKTRDDAADMLARIRTNETVSMNQKLEEVTNKAAIDKENYDNGFMANPETRDKIIKARDESPLGASDKLDKLFQEGVINDKLYKSYKKLYTDKNDAFDKITSNKAVKIDSTEILEKLKELGFKSSDNVDIAEDALDQVPTNLEDKLKRETEEFLQKKGRTSQGPSSPEVDAKLEASHPVFKEIGDMIVADPTAGNIAVNVHNRIKTEITRLRKSKVGRDQDMINRLTELDNFIKSKIPPEIQGDIDDAYDKFITFKTAWEDLDQMKEISLKGKERVNAERNKLPLGVTPEGQGVANWNDTVRRVWEQEKLNPSGEFVQSLIRAADAGGHPVRAEIADAIESRIYKDLGGKTLTGDQNMRTFRGILRNHIDTLNRIDPSRASKFVDMENQLIDLEKKSMASENTMVEFQKVYNKFKTESDNTVAAKFTSEVLDGEKSTGRYEGISNPMSVMTNIFRAKDSGNQIKRLMEAADKVGGGRGEVIKEAIRGSYWNYLTERTFGNTQGAMTVVDGKVVPSRNPRSQGLLLSNDEKIRNDITLLFGKETFDQFAQVERYLDDATRTFNRGKMVDQRLAPQDDPQKGMTSAITFMLGVLNPKATMAKRIAGPWAELSAEQLKDAKKAALVAAMADLPTAMKYMKMRPEELLSSMRSDEFKRFAARAYLNTEFKEKDRDFKVPQGLK